MKELGEFSDLQIGMTLIDVENENKEVKLTNLTTNSAEVELVRDTRWYDLEVVCNKCSKNHRIINSDRSKKFVCSSALVIEKDGQKFDVTCGGKTYTEIKKDYTGVVSAKQWFQYEKWFKERFKTI